MKKKSYTVSGNWNTLIHHNDDDSAASEQVMLATLCVIRDELKELNSLLHCQNFVNIPSVLREIQRNTKKKKRPKGKPVLRVVARS